MSADNSPTHTVVNKGTGYEVKLRISRSMQAGLDSTTAKVRNSARARLCILYRKECLAVHDVMPRFVDWGLLRIEPIRPPADLAPESSGDCCDDDRCTQCDIGYHSRCRSGCTAGRVVV